MLPYPFSHWLSRLKKEGIRFLFAGNCGFKCELWCCNPWHIIIQWHLTHIRFCLRFPIVHQAFCVSVLTTCVGSASPFHYHRSCFQQHGPTNLVCFKYFLQLHGSKFLLAGKSDELAYKETMLQCSQTGDPFVSARQTRWFHFRMQSFNVLFSDHFPDYGWPFSDFCVLSYEAPLHCQVCPQDSTWKPQVFFLLRKCNSVLLWSCLSPGLWLFLGKCRKPGYIVHCHFKNFVKLVQYIQKMEVEMVHSPMLSRTLSRSGDHI